MRNTLMVLAVCLGPVGSHAALAQTAPAVIAPATPELEVVIEPSRSAAAPKWCPSTHFNGAHLVCQTGGVSAVAGSATGGGYGVTLRLGSELIWKGTLFLADGGSSASISQNRTDSFACRPEPPRTRTTQSVSTSFSVRLSGYEAPRRLSISVQVTRPFMEPGGKLASCSDRGDGTKSLSFETQLDLPGGAPVTITGDAGLALTITPPVR